MSSPKRSKNSRTRSKKAFWKRDPFIASVTGHIGRIIDSGKLPDLLINAGLAYVGYRAFKPSTFESSILASLYGPIGLKLATTEGGSIASPSQIAGVAMLAFLGLAIVPQEVKDSVSSTVRESISKTPFGLPIEIPKVVTPQKLVLFGIKNPFTGDTIFEWAVQRRDS